MKSTNPITARVQSKFSNLTKDYSDCGCDSKSPAKNFSYAAKEAAESGAKEFSYAGKTFPVTAKKSMATKYNSMAKQTTGDVKVKDVPEVVKDAVVEGGKKVFEGGKKIVKKLLNTPISTEEGKKKREAKKALRKKQKEDQQKMQIQSKKWYHVENRPMPTIGDIDSVKRRAKIALKKIRDERARKEKMDKIRHKKEQFKKKI